MKRLYVSTILAASALCLSPGATAQLSADQASARSVVKAMPGWTANDIYNMDKVEKALLQAPAESIFFVKSQTVGNHRPEYAPTPQNRRDGLSVITTLGWSGFMTIWEDVFPYSDWKRREIRIHDHEPFVIWSIQGRKAQLVTLDGAIYSQQLESSTRPMYYPGLPAKSKRPEPMKVTYLTTGDIQFWESAGLVTSGSVTKLQKLRDDINTCSDKVWSGFDRQFEKIEMANINYHAREARLDKLEGRVRGAASKRCRKKVAAFEKAVKGHFESHLSRREKISAAVQKRVAKMPESAWDATVVATTYQGLVTHSEGSAPAPMGTKCAVKLTPADNHFNCRVQVTCGEATLYGSGKSGYNNCVVTKAGGAQAVEVHDGSSNDGDPQMDVVTKAKRVYVKNAPSGVTLWAVEILLSN